MSAVPHFRTRDGAAFADPGMPVAVHEPENGNTVQLLQDAIALLKSSNGDLPDHALVSNLLGEAREALERASIIRRAAEQSEGFLKESQFDKAFEVLDAGLIVYPGDPALVTRRRKVEEQQQAFHSAEAVRTALTQAEWLLHQDRTDLAAHYLEEKVADLPDQPALKARLEELEALLPYWEQKRHVQTTLGRVAALAQLQQWQAALTILEEAMQAYPSSEELIAEAKRVRDQLADHERQKKLARRLELIRQKIAAESWGAALTLLENAEKEFPGAPALSPLRCDVYAGLRRSECEAVVTEMRQCLTDGDLELAAEVLRRGQESFGQEPALQALREELESAREYREKLRTAQVLFGRRQLQEAERILSQLVGENRPEAQALLDTVKGARAAADEENFCERGREKAVDLIQQRQFAPAADLLRNLLALFPGNSILERDLMVAQNGLEQECLEGAVAAPKEDFGPQPDLIESASQCEPQPGARAGAGDRASVRENAPSRFRRAAIAGGVSLALVSAAGLAWNSSRNGVPVPRRLDAPAAGPVPTEAPLPVTQAAAPSTTVPAEASQTSSPKRPAPQTLAAAAPAGKSKSQPLPPLRTPLRPFVAPRANQTAGQPQSSSLPQPPVVELVISTGAIARPLAGLAGPLDGPAPPPADSPTGAAAAAAAPRPAAPVGGRATEATLVQRMLPVYPEFARAHGAFGVVRLEATIDERGSVKNVKVLSGDPVLAKAASTAVLTWKYKPATLNDRPIVSTATIQITFGDRTK